VKGQKDEKRWLDDAADPGRRAVRQALDEAGAPGEDQLSRQRVWAGVHTPWAAARSRRWPLVTAAAAGLAALMVLAGLQLFPRRDRVVSAPELAPVTGSGTIEVSGRQRLAGGVDAELAPRAALVPGDDGTPPQVKRGRVRFSVPHQPPGRRYAVQAGAYRITVLGTVFDVSVDDAAVHVSVSSGVVQIDDAVSGQRLERVAAGEEWSSLAPPPQRAPEPAPAARLTPPRRAPAPPDPAATNALAEAREARRTGQPQRALALYQRLVGEGGPLAESALFEMAAIEYEDLHDPDRALATWQRYRDRHPRGLLRAEADLSVIEVLARVGHEGRALDEARAFLARYPRSERRAEVARVAGDLARNRGDCRAAVALYEQAGASAAGRDADDAAFGRASCLRTLGDAGAAAALDDYRRRFPGGRHAADAARSSPR